MQSLSSDIEIENIFEPFQYLRISSISIFQAIVTFQHIRCPRMFIKYCAKSKCFFKKKYISFLYAFFSHNMSSFMFVVPDSIKFWIIKSKYLLKQYHKHVLLNTYCLPIFEEAYAKFGFSPISKDGNLYIKFFSWFTTWIGRLFNISPTENIYEIKFSDDYWIQV